MRLNGTLHIARLGPESFQVIFAPYQQVHGEDNLASLLAALQLPEETVTAALRAVRRDGHYVIREVRFPPDGPPPAGPGE